MKLDLNFHFDDLNLFLDLPDLILNYNLYLYIMERNLITTVTIPNFIIFPERVNNSVSRKTIRVKRKSIETLRIFRI